MAQQRARAAREDCGHPAGTSAAEPVADQIDAGVDGMQAAHRHSMVDGAAAEAQLQELPTGHGPVLALREFCDAQVNWATSTPT